MKHGWTGGQVSVVRVLLAADVAWRLLALGGQAEAWALSAAGLVVALLFALGVRLQLTGATLFACAAWLAATHGFDLGLSVSALLALMIGMAPGEPYGSWDRRGAADPGTDWRLPANVPLIAWILLSLSHALHGTVLIGTGFDATLLGLVLLMFGPLALLRSTRPWLFTGGLLLQLLGPWLGLSEGSPALAIPHLLLFDPAWIGPRSRAGKASTAFYDGGCALCHGAVRFLIAEDVEGTRFRYAPLDSDAFRDAVARASLSPVPDSMALLSVDGRLLLRSDALLRAAEELGGLWRAAAWVTLLLPRGLRDRAYDGVAANRYRVFGTKEDACPLIPTDIRGRFDF